MIFKYYNNFVTQASRHLAAWLFLVGLLLIGFGVLIFVLRDFFAFLAAVVFFIAGVGCGITALKMYIASWLIDRARRKGQYRDNVEIHRDE